MDKIKINSKKVLVNKGLGDIATAAFICCEAQKVISAVFSKDFSREVRVASFRDGFLNVESSSSSHAQEVVLRQAEVLKQINKKLGSEMIRRIKFRACLESKTRQESRRA